MPPNTLVTEDGTQLDPKVVKVMRAIRTVETKGSPDPWNQAGDGGKSKGAYQWNNGKDLIKPGQTPANFQAAAKQFGLDPNDFSPANQNKVAYHQIKAYKDQGLQPEEIAALWNGASKDKATGQFIYNAPEYGEKFRAALQTVDTPQAPAPQAPSDDEIAQQQSGATFGATTGEGPLAAGLKTLGNVPASLGRFAMGAFDAINPFATLGRLSEIPQVIGDIAGQKQKPGQLAGNLAGGVYDTVVPQAGRELASGVAGTVTGDRFGRADDLAAAQRSVTNDPIGSVAPFVLGARGAAGLADSVASRGAMRSYVQNIGENTANGIPIPKPSTQFTSAFDNTISKVGGPVGKIVGAPVKLAGDLIGKTADFGIKQATGLSGETRATISENPSAFTKGARSTFDRASLGKTIQSELNRRIDGLDDSKEAYGPIRGRGGRVPVDPDFIDKNISEIAGTTFKKGKIQPSTTSKIRDARDVAALQTIYDFWKPAFKRGYLSPEEFLNFRSDLAKAAKYGRDIGKSAPVEDVASVVRGRLNSAYRGKITGLDKLDEQTSTQINEFKELKKGLLDKEGHLTDGAITRIANATNKGRDAVLARLEEIKPGITRQIKIVKALEDIEKASENKVGTYARAALGAGSLITLNIPGLIATILAQPEVAVPILRTYGFAKPLVTPVVRALKASASAVNDAAQSGLIPSFLPQKPESLLR